MALVPKHIKQLSPYQAGKPIEEVRREFGLEKIVKLASNENPLGPSSKVILAVTNSLKNTHRYPDASGFSLRNRLANKFNLKLENVVLGAGSEGIMSVIMRTFLLPTDEIIAARNSFIGFRVLANSSGIHTNWVTMRDYRYDLNAMAKCINEYTKVIYLANPDNPTGTYFTKDEFDQFMKKVPDRVIVILDEAYFEFAMNKKDYPDSMYYRYDNVITLRTFSKAYGLAGFRIGYGFGHEDLIGNILKVKLPFEPSLPAQIAGLTALDDEVYLNYALKINNDGMEYITSSFKKIGYDFIESSTNFVTLILDSPLEAEILCSELLKRGVIVRHLKGFGWAECVRISIGTMDENKYFISILKKIILK
ncbi:MAG: histidinol-phosphate transaminase [Candidatus Marinimicrobia bacterium]|nr:histidinol-phosphate transaminase [Candidatus Neomarinimicrobiota bacterium]